MRGSPDLCQQNLSAALKVEPVRSSNSTQESIMKETSVMRLGMVGLGRMGANMVRRLIKGGHQCVVYDRSPQAVKDLTQEKAVGAASPDDFVRKLAKPRVVWLM